MMSPMHSLAKLGPEEWYVHRTFKVEKNGMTPLILCIGFTLNSIALVVAFVVDFVVAFVVD